MGTSANWAKRVVKSVANRIANVLFKVSPTLAWRIAQRWELRFHRKDTWRHSPDFMDQTVKLFDNFGFHRDEYAGRVVVDVGAGSKLRTKYFRDGRIFVIEPLADHFMADIPECDLGAAERVFAISAEERVTDLIDKADLVISINVLDHCYEFERIIGNIHAYLVGDGLAFLSFDSHEYTNIGHPLILNEPKCRAVFEKVGFHVERFERGLGPVGEAYGHVGALNFWLRRRG